MTVTGVLQLSESLFLKFPEASDFMAKCGGGGGGRPLQRNIWAMKKRPVWLFRGFVGDGNPTQLYRNYNKPNMSGSLLINQDSMDSN